MTGYTQFLKVNKYDFAQTTPTKKLSGNAKKSADAEQAIIDTIKYLGWMSLKDSDHCEYGKSVGQGDARRAAAERMIADGRIVLLGTWSNGIAVGPGAGFVHATAQAEVIAAPKKQARTRKPVARETKPATWRMVEGRCDMLPAHPMYDIAIAARSRQMNADAKQETADFFYSREGACSPMRYDAGAACPITLAVSKPRVRYTWPKVAPVGEDVEAAQLSTRIEAIRAMRGDNDYIDYTWATPGATCAWTPAQTVSAAPTPIYAPAVGDSVFIVLRHENGTTTDRVVDVQRVKLEAGRVVLFRGYDRRRDRCRNYQVADCPIMRAWDGLEVCDMNGRVVVEARAA